MSQPDPRAQPIPYAQSLHRGVDPVVLYRIIAISGVLAAVGRLSTPVRIIGQTPSVLLTPFRFGMPYGSSALSLLMLLAGTYSAIALLLVSIGLFSGNRRAGRWLWTSEPAAILVVLINYGSNWSLYWQQTRGLPPGFFASFALGVFGSVALPIGLILLMSAAEAADLRDEPT